MLKFCCSVFALTWLFSDIYFPFTGAYMEDACLYWGPASDGCGFVDCQTVSSSSMLPLRSHAPHPNQTVSSSIRLHKFWIKCGKSIIVFFCKSKLLVRYIDMSCFDGVTIIIQSWCKGESITITHHFQKAGSMHK